jgi:hypothetical protein
METKKEYRIGMITGYYGELYTFDDACKRALVESVQNSDMRIVQHIHGYVPDLIFHSGFQYQGIPVDIPNAVFRGADWREVYPASPADQQEDAQ